MRRGEKGGGGVLIKKAQCGQVFPYSSGSLLPPPFLTKMRRPHAVRESITVWGGGVDNRRDCLLFLTKWTFGKLLFATGSAGVSF